MGELFEIVDMQAVYAMVQRLGFCLRAPAFCFSTPAEGASRRNGVGQNLGTGGMSQAKLFAPAAERFLKKRGLSRTYTT